MFFPTGVAAQNAALAVYADLPFRSHRTEPPPSVILHGTSHLVKYEEEAYSQLLGLTALIAGDEHRILAVSDVEGHLSRLAAVGSRPVVILVELPHRVLGCETLPWDELLALRELADKYDVPLHLDGARLWEIAPFYAATSGKSVRDITNLFDSVYVSFYKGLGAITGAMLLGSAKFIDQAAPWRRRLGANPYTVWPYAVSCRDAFHRHADTFSERWQKLRALVPQIAEAARAEGGSFRTCPAEPHCCQALACIGLRVDEPEGGNVPGVDAMDKARDAVEAALGVRVYGRLLDTPPMLSGSSSKQSTSEQQFEMCLGPAHVDLPDAVFVEAWAAFFRALREEFDL